MQSLACARGRRVLFEQLDMTLAPGQAVRVTGANGRGKTTLLRTLAGLRLPHAGRVSWAGRDVHTEDAFADGDLLYLGHENALNPGLTAVENLTALRTLHGRRGDIRAGLQRFGVGTTADRPCRTLSAGQRRRSALARLCLDGARLWLLDEPAAALDAAARQVLGDVIGAHVAAGGLVLFTTHEVLDIPQTPVRSLTL